MNKTQQRTMRYAQLINGMIQNLEDNQTDLNSDYERLKEAIEADKVADITSDDYWTIQENFQKGTDSYKDQLQKLKRGQAPAKLMGTHHLLLDAYEEFVDGCQDMVDSMLDDRTVDSEKFLMAEQAQDTATDKISKYIQKITQLI
ncbi:hypothetical protein ACFQ5M_12575 [Agrilactobacillus yilanensis]|uniref:DUF5082 domain-containing protein n=1 Tax=Agrilactobacillus yilanensis TaxID=2485997 RepID=A0ABW4J997_9LACO|nr:hypothetical protein [Agrilactobacillus yilanensis]